VKEWKREDLHFVALEELILLAASAFGALEAADNKHGHSQRHQNGEHRRIQPEPCQQTVHITNAEAQLSTKSRYSCPVQKAIYCEVQY
jgi:hypothetical protein